ncbi:uncharacterized protein WM277_007602 isoform 1-T2 [Molossus nigricans]
MRVPSRCGDWKQAVRTERWKRGSGWLLGDGTLRWDVQALKGQEKAFPRHLLSLAGGPTRRYVRGCTRRSCRPREREARARYGCAQALWARDPSGAKARERWRTRPAQVPSVGAGPAGANRPAWFPPDPVCLHPQRGRARLPPKDMILV